MVCIHVSHYELWLLVMDVCALSLYDQKERDREKIKSAYILTKVPILFLFYFCGQKEVQFCSFQKQVFIIYKTYTNQDGVEMSFMI